MNYPFRLLFVRKGNDIYYRVVYQDDLFDRVNVAGSSLSIASSACPAYHTDDIFVRGWMTGKNHHTMHTYLSDDDISYLFNLQNKTKEHYELSI
jgi:hypothetical protein